MNKLVWLIVGMGVLLIGGMLIWAATIDVQQTSSPNQIKGIEFKELERLCIATNGQFNGCPQCPAGAVCEICLPCSCPIDSEFTHDRGCVSEQSVVNEYVEKPGSCDNTNDCILIDDISAEHEICLAVSDEQSFRDSLELRAYTFPKTDQLKPTERGLTCQCIQNNCEFAA